MSYFLPSFFLLCTSGIWSDILKTYSNVCTWKENSFNKRETTRNKSFYRFLGRIFWYFSHEKCFCLFVLKLTLSIFSHYRMVIYFLNKTNWLKWTKSVINEGAMIYHIMYVRLTIGRTNNTISYWVCQIGVWTNGEWSTILSDGRWMKEH